MPGPLSPAIRCVFFQAEDGIRDIGVTGVQTCTLPISHREKFEPGTNLRAWLFTILRNTYYTAVTRRRREVSDGEGKHAATLTAPPTQDWSVAMRSLEGALRQLPDEHREALILVGAAGLTYDEAAEICGCALGTIKSRVNRARARLLKIMEADSAVDALRLEEHTS